ncbi:actin protein 2/3 complex subunit-like protein [Tasmannia lanceolata]|uniref:actin protein 2/3 complex subunit-like protein n=1 Tax=Tasmannia lanceolata TaxID=3420 RepID=UPI0040638C66
MMDMDMDAPLDFESDDPLLSLPLPVSTKKRRKVIGLDDLVSDFYKEKSKTGARKSKSGKNYNSDEDDDRTRNKKEALLSKFVDDCQKQVHDIVTEAEIPLWGQRIFGPQKAPPSLSFPGLGSCKLLQSFTNSELNLMLELNSEKGETFIEGLIINGWLSKLVLTCGHVEESIASYSFYLMLYSSNEGLQASACEFWLAILPSVNKVDLPSVIFDWFPSYTELKHALEVYGYLSCSSTNISSLSEVDSKDSCSEGPPRNIRSWIKFLGACCQIRSIQPIFSTSEVEEFLGVIIYLFLDRRLQGLSLLLHECMLSVISFFTDSEWISSCEKVANSLAYRLPKDMNCLKIVECIPGSTTRSKHLRSKVAFQILINCFDTKVTGAEDVLALLLSINLKDKKCDFFKIYIYLVLAENWLFSSSLLDQRPVILEMWGVYLRNCSSQITSTDWRSFASKVRNKASYLLQTTTQKKEF